jgi:Holliday junction resolvase
MAKADSKRGIQRERDLVNSLREGGWFALRAPASLGVADVVALKDGERPRLIECKSTRAGKYSGFLPADRKALAEAADRAGADAFLYWHPPRRKPQWIPRSDWPDAA